jgi:hypothetical protein
MATTEEQLRAWIDQETRRLETQRGNYLRGHNWCDVSIAEQEVFGLSPETVARAVTVFDAYLAIADIALNELHKTPLCKAAREAYPWIEQGRTDPRTFSRFAKLFGVSNRQADAFFSKHDFWQIRQGLVTFGDETEEDRLRAQSEAGLWPDDHPRMRALYPQNSAVSRSDPQVLVTLSLDKALYDWLKGFVGRNSFTFDVEEAIYTALRCMRGSEGGMNLDTLAGIVASERGTSPIEAIFGEIKDQQLRKAATLLLDAADIARRRHSPHLVDMLLPEDETERNQVLALLRVVLPDWDPIREIEEEEAAEQKWLEEHGGELAAEVEAKTPQARGDSRKGPDFDDDIPF